MGDLFLILMLALFSLAGHAIDRSPRPSPGCLRCFHLGDFR